MTTREPLLRIALISEHASPLAKPGGVDAGGQNVYVAQVACALAALGHHVDVYTRCDSIRLPACAFLRSRVRVMHVDAGPACFVPKEQLLSHMPAFARGMRNAMEHAGRYDIVHANFFMSGWVGMALQRACALPLAVTFHALGLVRQQHQGSADGFPQARIGIERRLVHRAQRVIAECPQEREDLLRLYGADAARISTVPCGVDLAQFGPRNRAAARRRLGLPQDEFIVLQLGRLVPRKGVEHVVRAMALLDAGMPARLLVVGGESRQPDDARTPELGRLRAIAQQCGAAQRVVFVGQRDRQELADYYAAADVFATTPAYEPFGITPLEAMACGKPVVGSAVGGIQHTVVDGVTGFLVPPADPAALAERFARLHANAALGEAMGRAGMARVRSLFTWDQVAQGLVKAYREAIASSCEQHAGARPQLQRTARTLSLGAVA